MANLQKVVKLTQAQYDILAAGGTVGSYTGLNANYIYLVQEATKTYTGLIGTSNEYKNASFYFINVTPDDWNKEWSISYRLEVNLDDGITPTNYQQMSSVHECYIAGSRGYYQAYSFFNSINNTSYRPVFYNLLHETTETGFNNDYSHKIGVELTSSSYPTDINYKRTITVTILNTTGCSAQVLDEPEIPSQSDRSDYTKLNSTYYPNGVNSNAPGYAWRGDLYSQGLRETGDDNTTDQMYYHNQWMTISSNLGLQGSSLFGLNTSGEIMAISVSNPSSPSDTINISTTRIYNEGGFDWSRGLMKCVNGGYLAPSTTNLIHSYKVLSFDFRYTDNHLNADNTNLTMIADKFVYLRGTIGSDGLFYLAPYEVSYNSATYKRVWTQDEPTSEDGYVYWLVGHPYSGSTASAYIYNVRLYAENPLYWFKDGKFREYTPGSVGVKRYI